MKNHYMMITHAFIKCEFIILNQRILKTYDGDLKCPSNNEAG